MKQLLSDVIAELNRTKQSGQLSLSVKGGNSLFKIFFKDGKVYHITCGEKADADCLEIFDGSEFSEVFFLPNIRVDIPNVTVPPTEHLIQFFRDRQLTVEMKQPLAAGTGAASQAPAGANGFVRIQEGLRVALIRQIGPVGGKVLLKVLQEKWNVASPTKEDLRALIDLLKAEIDDAENKNEFAKEAEKLIS